MYFWLNSEKKQQKIITIISMASWEHGLVLEAQPPCPDAATRGSSADPAAPIRSIGHGLPGDSLEGGISTEKMHPELETSKMMVGRTRQASWWQSNTSCCLSCAFPAVGSGRWLLVAQTGPHGDGQAHVRLPGAVVQFPFKEETSWG